LYAAGEHGDLLYYTMRYIEGESLKHALHAGTRFSLRDIVRMLHDVVDALAYAHERGVVHRDIKPGNVLLSGRHAVVTDFGVAKAISASMPAVGMTTSGMAIGTPAYMAPEQLAGDPAADHRVDIFAVGLLAYELLTGDAPFAEASPQQTLAAQLTRDPEPIAKRRPDVPAALATAVMHCLAKMPEKRPQSAGELLTLLDAIETPSGDYPPSTPPSRKRAAMVVGLVAAIAAFVFAQRQWSSRSAPHKASPDTSVIAHAPASGAGASAPAAPAALTHADSLAIARAVEKKMAERTTAAPAPARLDSAAIAKIASTLRAEIEKAVLDSLEKSRPPVPPPGSARGSQVFIDRNGGGRRFTSLSPMQVDSIVRMTRGTAEGIAELNRARGMSGALDRGAFDARAASLGAPRRVVVWNHPPDRRNQTMQDAGSAIMNVLRKALSGQARFVAVERDSTLATLTRSRNRDSVAAVLNADMMATIRGNMMPGDSVTWVLTVWDLTAHNAYSQRAVSAGKVALSDPLANVDSLVQRSVRALQEMDRAPRRAVTVEHPGVAIQPVAPQPPQFPPPAKKP
jgi:hypothetical protein